MRSAAREAPPLVSRIIASEDRIAEAGAEVLQLDVGRVVRQRACPHVFDANQVRHPRLDGHDLDGALGRLRAPLREVGAAHLQISADAGSLAGGLDGELASRGFRRERLVAMVLDGTPARAPAAGITVRAVPDEAPFGWYADVMDLMSREEPWYTPSLSREIVTSVEAKVWAGALVPHVAVVAGRAAGAASLAPGAGGAPGVAALTGVGTLPSHRRRGVAQTLVVELARRALIAGSDLVYLVARADDTPQEMYRKLGFRPVHPFDVWLLPPG